MSEREPIEDFVPEDDAVIGRALRISGLAILVIAAIAGIVWTLTKEEIAPEEIKEKEARAVPDLPVEEATLPPSVFSDITEGAGITFVHDNGARGEKLLPETMGGGVAFFDYDGDGDADLLCVNGTSWPQDANRESPGHRLFLNDGSGHFTDATEASNLKTDHYGMGAAVGDYDGDGRVDVLITGIGGNRLLRNSPEGFADVTQSAGLENDPDDWTSSAGFFDYDKDGDLDLFVCHYVAWSRAVDEKLAFTLNGVDRAYGPPMSYSGNFSSLYRNEGDGTFKDVSEEAGIQVANRVTGRPMGKALGVAFADFDMDDHPDIVVANDTVQNHLFHNRGDGTFVEIGAESGVGFDSNGNATGAMGIDIGDYRGDGAFGIGIANFANEMSSLYAAAPDTLNFSDNSIGEGLGSPSREKLSFGLFFFDYDLDGRLDLLQVNGHLEETINEVQPSQHYLQSPQLFWNAGENARSCYRVVPQHATGDLGEKLAGRGSAYADIDGDGDLDIALAQVGAPLRLLRNDREPGNHWLRVRLQGRAPNPDALGAWITLEAGGQTLRRQVTATRSYLSQSELTVTFGLGDTSELRKLEVRWPDGESTVVEPVPEVDTAVVITRE